MPEPEVAVITFLPVHDAPIQLLVHKLSFIRDPQRWGYPFRTGHFAITQADFEIIASAMGADALSFAG